MKPSVFRARMALRWQVLVDDPGQHAPRVVERFAAEEEARELAARLNAQGGLRPALYFVEFWETCNVLDLEHCTSREGGASC